MQTDLGLNPSSAPHQMQNPRPVTLPALEWRPESLLCTFVESAHQPPSLLVAAPVWHVVAPSSFKEAPTFSGCPRASSTCLSHPVSKLSRAETRQGCVLLTVLYQHTQFSWQPWEGGVMTIIPILQMPNLRHGEVKSLAHGHTICRR